jgi:hypothetical protein
MHVRQFNGNSNTSLVSDTHSKYKKINLDARYGRYFQFLFLDSTMYMEDGAGVSLATHTMMTEIKLEIVFTGECSPWRMSVTCDNLKSQLHTIIITHCLSTSCFCCLILFFSQIRCFPVFNFTYNRTC